MGLENARSCPHSSHLHGLWMKCSGSGIPGERRPGASHTPCNILHFQVSPFSMSRSILMPLFPVNSPSPLYHHLHNPDIFSTTYSPLSGRKPKPSGFSVIQKLCGGAFVSLSIPSNKLTWHQVRNTQHGIHKHL